MCLSTRENCFSGSAQAVCMSARSTHGKTKKTLRLHETFAAHQYVDAENLHIQATVSGGQSSDGNIAL
jgi:hypothetical protein